MTNELSRQDAHGSRTTRRRYILIALVACPTVIMAAATAVAIYHYAHDDWTKERIGSSQQYGNEVVNALHEFKRKNGHYPTRIEDLAPNYISAVKPPTAGNTGWIYVTDPARQGFAIGFRRSENSYESCDYTDDVGWRCNDRF